MSSITSGRSPVEIAEDQLLAMCQPVHNVSRETAARLSIQRREVASDIRQLAERLLQGWEASRQQCEEVGKLYLPWLHATRSAA
jgi:hypothetical protein